METKILILKMIAKHDGKWTWYQIERGLNAKGLGGVVNSTEVLQALIDEGFITTKSDPRYPSPLYSITELGRAILLKEAEE
ncbi:hypothetical protein [Pseudomonas indica]|uniref:hypothetical protein n=1 Tax=Pseudomonas indica TaxID=137658 RepID=UPI00111373CD|nr:hypothetical protein [Pseudomonas indica]MBU3059257.1 hypothetical protein [Pseudomonas indica]